MKAYDLIIKKLNGFNYEIINHEKIINSKQGLAIFNNSNCFKTLGFEYQNNIYLILINANDLLDYKKLTNELQIKRNELKKLSDIEILGYENGSLAPIPIKENMITIIDDKIKNYNEIICGIGINTKSLKINTNDLIKITNGKIVNIRR